MGIYPIMKFIHIISDITLFVGVGAQLLGHLALRRVTRFEQAHLLLGLISLSDRIGVTGAFLTIASGVYMAATVWTFEVSWIMVALGSIALFIGPLIGLVAEPRNKALVRAAKDNQSGELTDSFSAQVESPILTGAIMTNMAVVAGIVFLMTTKPDLILSIVAMVTALALGLASAAIFWLTTRRATDHRADGEPVVQ